MGLAFPVAGGETEGARRGIEVEEASRGVGTEGARQEGVSFGSDESIFVWSADNEVVCGRWTEGEGREGGVTGAGKGRGKGEAGRGGKGGEEGEGGGGGRGRAQPSREKVDQQYREQKSREQKTCTDAICKEDVGSTPREGGRTWLEERRAPGEAEAEAEGEAVEGGRGASRVHQSFRGDSAWCGVARDFNSNLLAGWCMSGSFIVADCTH
ncbi:hypothetical protein CLOP_g4580 [Closterium sp. NIES-67]|nr:hypothetical protein CLOP_g4580 [Closterium sp. NIES-67]